jgi:hypothetical protein
MKDWMLDIDIACNRITALHYTGGVLGAGLGFGSACTWTRLFGLTRSKFSKMRISCSFNPLID